jgi:hypothetical protein
MTAPILRPQWRLRDGKPRCSWCLAETNTPPIPGESHGICSRHKREMIAEARADAQGKRPDQVAFSWAALLIIGVLLVALGVLAYLGMAF